MTHTPAPWKAIYNDKFGNYQIMSEKKDSSYGGHWIANTKCESCPAKHEANARLMAASPELLEALEIAWSNIDPANTTDKDSDIILKAISKARGQ